MPSPETTRLTSASAMQQRTGTNPHRSGLNLLGEHPNVAQERAANRRRTRLLRCVPIGLAASISACSTHSVDELTESDRQTIANAPEDFEHPFVGWLKYPNGNNHCTGSQIAERWVLSAGHCVASPTWEVDGQVYSGRDYEVAPGFAESTYGVQHDLLLIRIEASVRPPLVKVIRASTQLPQRQRTIVGYGDPQSDRTHPIKRSALFDVTGKDDRFDYFVAQRAAGGLLGGDSGGPWLTAGNELFAVTSANRGDDSLGTAITDAHYQWIADTLTAELPSDVRAKYLQVGGAPSFLGLPQTAQHDTCGTAHYVNFWGDSAWIGRILSSPSTGAHEVHGLVGAHWSDLGAECGPLGLPVTDETDAPGGGRVSYFNGNVCASGPAANGSGSAVYFRGDIGAHAVTGCIYDKYWRSAGGPSGDLGYPVSDQRSLANGNASYFEGHGCGNERGPENSGSAIYESGASGDHIVRGCIYTSYWRDHSGPEGHLSFPVSDEFIINGGAVSYFLGHGCANDKGPYGSGSAIYASGAGVHAVQGCIYTKYWRDEGEYSGHLSFPASNELPISGGAVSYFSGHGCGNERGPNNSGSAIYAGPGGVHTVQGCIYTKYWRDEGEYSGHLSFPASDEIPISGGAVSYFSGHGCGNERGPNNSGSAIYAGPGGIHTVQGCIYTKYWRDEGEYAGHLGYPTSDEMKIAGGAVSYFAGNGCGNIKGPYGSGSAIYAGPGGIHTVQGCIYAKYQEVGAQSSSLGYPTGDEVHFSGGWISHFQGGYIVADGSSVNVFFY